MIQRIEEKLRSAMSQFGELWDTRWEIYWDLGRNLREGAKSPTLWAYQIKELYIFPSSLVLKLFYSICSCFRFHRSNQSGPTRGGDGWRRDDSHHMGVYQGQGI